MPTEIGPIVATASCSADSELRTRTYFLQVAPTAPGLYLQRPTYEREPEHLDLMFPLISLPFTCMWLSRIIIIHLVGIYRGSLNKAICRPRRIVWQTCWVGPTFGHEVDVVCLTRTCTCMTSSESLGRTLSIISYYLAYLLNCILIYLITLERTLSQKMVANQKWRTTRS